MKISIFLSYPRPYNDAQSAFISALSNYLEAQGLEARTLGVSDYDMDAPLKTIRRLMLESNGLITVAFRRTQIIEGKIKPGHADELVISNRWLTSPYSHIEPAMAFQIGLPVLVFRENGVLADGILEKGVLGIYMPEFDLSSTASDYLNSAEFSQIIKKWESQVRAVVEAKGVPPKLY